MKWEKYKRLSKSLKEEYDFRFTDSKINLKTDNLILGLISITAIYTVSVFIYYLFLTDVRFVDSVDAAKVLWLQLGSLLKTGLIIIILFTIFNVGTVITNLTKELLWLRKNKIKILPIWITKMFKSKK